MFRAASYWQDFKAEAEDVCTRQVKLLNKVPVLNPLLNVKSVAGMPENPRRIHWIQDSRLRIRLELPNSKRPSHAAK